MESETLLTRNECGYRTVPMENGTLEHRDGAYAGKIVKAIFLPQPRAAVSCMRNNVNSKKISQEEITC